MINPSGADQIVKKIAEHSMQEGGAQPQQASLQDQSRFQDAMQAKSEGGETQQVNASSSDVKSQQTHAIASDTKVEKPSSGDSLLQGIDKMRSSIQDGVTQIQSAATDNNLSIQEVFKAQVQVGKSMADQQITSKVGEKSNQNLDTLLKGRIVRLRSRVGVLVATTSNSLYFAVGFSWLRG